ncbi:diacylglycerol/lipid kinase family protein [Candidatus Solincola sp.]|nr:diacylglycerol kinase family protein [Actinomycetota bacterium]MDI7251428.1 diacylglycerol kinase family protein [Actinomycetota bacterium]
MVFFTCVREAGPRSFPSFLFSLPLMGIAVITNVEAGKNRNGRYKQYHLPEMVGDRGLVVETETMEEIDGAMDRILSRGERVICLNGGDGTVQRALTRLVNRLGEDEDSLPAIFPLRGGTMNLLADHLNIKGSTPELMQAALRAVEDDGELPCVHVPTLRVTRRMGEREEREYGFFFGHGALYRFHRVYYRDTKGGPLAAAVLFAKCTFGGATGLTRYKDVFGMAPARLVIDDFEMPGDRFTVILAVIFKVVVITFDAFRDVGEGDFYVLATNIPFFRMVGRLPRLLWARGAEPPYPREEFFNERAKRVFIECREGYSLDGEVFELEEPYTLTIDRGPTVRVLMPPLPGEG